MKQSRITIIGGAGNVGSTIAYALMMKNIAGEILLIDQNEEKLKGELMDLSDAIAFCDTSIIKSGNYEGARDSDIIIISAGAPQMPGETRIDLLKKNKKIIEEIISNLKPINKDTILLLVTNPVDIITYFAQEISGLPKNQVIGSGTLLDTQRLRGYLSEKLNVAEQSIHACVLGEHGDSEFIAWSHANIAGKLLINFGELSKKDLEEIEYKTKNEAYNIIKSKGSTYYGIAACVTKICENIIFNQKKIMPVSCYVKSLGVCLGMPAVLGSMGIEKIIEIPLSLDETQKLKNSADTLSNIIKNYEQ